MKFTLLGTGNSAMLPVYGCECTACRRAMDEPKYRRNKTSAMVKINGKTLLIDANLPNLLERFPPKSIDRILLTHYHMDHVHSLFDLRFGFFRTQEERIPVNGPHDSLGCDDLYKHPGLLAFQPPFKPFETFEWEGIRITTLPLNHSKLCLGYVFEWQGRRLAYLTDTFGLSEPAQNWLKMNPVEWLFIDCGYPPQAFRGDGAVRNHSTVEQILAIKKECQPVKVGLIHIGHELENWAISQPDCFSENLFLAQDGLCVTFQSDNQSGICSVI